MQQLPSLHHFKTPYGVSVYSNIPIQFLSLVKERLRGAAGLGFRWKYRPRGPRPDSRYNTVMKDANRFSVYLERDYGRFSL